MKLRKILITGGAGFIGSNLADELIADNQVTIIDDLSTGRLENITKFNTNENGKFIRGSILNRELLEYVFQGVDIVFHLAAIPSVARSIDDPVSTNEVNILGTLNVLIAARNNKVKNVVFASSSAVYGETTILPAKENMPLDLRSPYALTKVAGEYYCNIFRNIYGIHTACLRYFNVYGPRQNSNSEYSAVIPDFISKVLNNKSPVIYGDGNQTRDFVFVEDVVQANVIVAESDATGIFNIGLGCNTSINDLAKDIMTILGRSLPLTHKDSRTGDVRNSLADITSIRYLGYEPKYKLESGLRKTIRGFQNGN